MGLLSRYKKSSKEGAQAVPEPVKPQAPQAPWDGTRFKIQLKMAKSRIEIQRSKKDNEIDSIRRKIGQHLIDNKEPLAKILGERVLREKQILIAFDVIETCIEVLISSNNNLSTNRDLEKAPGDLKSSISSVVFSASRVNVPELITVVNILSTHYGHHIIDPINRMEGPFKNYIDENLTIVLAGNPPDGYLILQELTEIANQHNLAWKPPPEDSDLNEFKFNQPNNNGNDDPYSGGGGYGGHGGHGGYGGGGHYMPDYTPSAPSNIPGAAMSAPFTPFAPSAPSAPSAPPGPPMAHFPQPPTGGYPSGPRNADAGHFPSAPPPNDSAGSVNDDALQARFKDILDDN